MPIGIRISVDNLFLAWGIVKHYEISVLALAYHLWAKFERPI